MLLPYKQFRDRKRDQQLQDAITALSGLVAYYPLNEESGDAINNAPDTIGTNDGVVTGMTRYQVGQVGRAYQFNGVGDKIVENATASFLNTDNVSLISLFKLNADAVDSGDSQQLVVLNKWRMHVRTPENTVEWRFDNSGAVISQYNLGMGDRNWHMAVGTYENIDGTNSQLKLYIDGVLRDSDTAAKLTGTSYTEGIGILNTSFYAGLMQHVAIVKGLLSATEIANLATIAGLL